MKRCKLICPCPKDNENKKKNKNTVNSVLGPTPFSPYGVSPYFVQITNPSLYQLNESLEEEAGKKGELGMPEDPDLPSDSRSDPLAWTPMYRGNQNSVFDVQFDPYTYHGVGSESATYTDGTWYEWDGSTTFPIWIENTKTTAEKQAHRQAWYDFVFPGKSTGNFCIRGLKQLYELHQPFADPYNPTVHEWELWNDKVLNHFRFLSGLSSAYPSPELYIMCAWTFERKSTNLWDTKYPGTLDSAYGPCSGGTNIHCGTTFKPSDVNDQYAYWNEIFTKYPKVVLPGPITLNQATEAITVWYNGTAMTAFSRNLNKLFEGCSLGNQIGGHAGPYAFRQLYGLRIGRSKWAGTLEQPPEGYTY